MSYVFTHEGIKRFLKDSGLSIVDEYIDIHDYYFSKNARLRYISQNGNVQVVVTHKTGDKYRGYRIEKEFPMDIHASDLLISETSLEIEKRRFKIDIKAIDGKPYHVSVDFITKPMKIAVLEIEAADPISIPLPLDIGQRLFGLDIQNCPLGTWEYFNRKIGFCGGPSCGKSEMAKWLSHVINTEFNGNSFHVTEYATSFIQKYGRNPQFCDQILLWYGQWKREHNARNADIVISDCPTFLSYIYAQLAHKVELCDESALQLAKMYKQSLFDVSSYSDIWFMEIRDYVNNKVRYQTEDEAIQIQEKIRTFLLDHNIPYRIADYKNSHQVLKDVLFLNIFGDKFDRQPIEE